MRKNQEIYIDASRRRSSAWKKPCFPALPLQQCFLWATPIGNWCVRCSSKSTGMFGIFPPEQWPFPCIFNLDKRSWASLVAQWLRIRLPMQGTRVGALFQEDPTCHRAIKPVRHNYWDCALEPVSHNYWSLRSRGRAPQLLSPRATTTEARAPRARAPQQEKPLQWEARAPQWRAAPARRN